MSENGDWSGPMKELIRSYNDPVEVPRDEMWAEIHARLGEEPGAEAEPGDDVSRDDAADATVVPISSARRHSWLRPTLAAAAILVIGVAVGRWSAIADPGLDGAGEVGSVAAGGEASGPSAGDTGAPFQLAAATYLAQTESLVTLFRADSRTGAVDPAVREWARALLTQTRVLMETKQAEEPGVQALLEDLELVLVQISQLPAEGDPRLDAEVEWIGEDIEAQAILPRVQAAQPQTPVYAGI
jgi:hypothetical protein